MLYDNIIKDNSHLITLQPLYFETEIQHYVIHFIAYGLRLVFHRFLVAVALTTRPPLSVYPFFIQLMSVLSAAMVPALETTPVIRAMSMASSNPTTAP